MDKETLNQKLPDICVDYCESSNCRGCKYENATLKEKEEAYQKIMEKESKYV